MMGCVAWIIMDVPNQAADVQKAMPTGIFTGLDAKENAGKK